MEPAAIGVGLVRPVQLLESEARRSLVPGNVRTVGHHAVRHRERGSQGQIAPDIVIHSGPRVRPHVDRRDRGLPTAFGQSIATIAQPGTSHTLEVEAEDHAHVKERLIANGAPGQQVLNGLLMAIGGIGKLRLGHLLLDHRRTYEGDRRCRLSFCTHDPALPSDVCPAQR